MNKNNYKYSVLTSNGFVGFEGIKETIRKNNIKFYFNDTTNITVTDEHRFFVGKSNAKIFRKANKLKIGNKIDKKTIINIEYDVECSNKFYDLINVENGNHYKTSGVTSHNCAFIRPSVWEEFIDAFLPSQASLSWKKNIILSTPKGMNHFYNLVKGASPKYNTDGSGVKEKGNNGYSLFKVDWRDVPRYDHLGNRLSNENFMNNIIKKHGILYFKQNFSCDFLGSSHTLISSEKLANMTQLPIQETRDGKLKIYEYPQKGHKYIFAVDPAKDGRDAFACQIVDITDFTFKQVAAAQIQIDYLLMPEFIFEWAEMYNNAYLIIENNEGAGQSIADQLYKDYEYENLHFDKDSQSNKRKKYPGFRTTTRSRKLILQTLKLFIENDRLNICDASTMNEFLTFILVNNKYQADDGAHDDMIMSLALIFVPFCNARNFEDMKDLIKNLYKVDIEEDSEDTDKKDKKKTFTEHMMIGDFADYGEIEMPTQQSYSWNGFIVEYGSE